MLVAMREKNPLVDEALLPSSPTFTARSTKKISSWDLSSLSVDELWVLREEVGASLTGRMSAELRVLKKRLAQLKAEEHGKASSNGKSESPSSRKRRPYPPVL